MAHMTSRLEEAFAEAAKLSEPEQETFAEFLLAELREEREWQTRFSARPDVLSKLAQEARADHAAGRTAPLEDLFN
jgi:hypothetical protein